MLNETKRLLLTLALAGAALPACGSDDDGGTGNTGGAPVGGAEAPDASPGGEPAPGGQPAPGGEPAPGGQPAPGGEPAPGGQPAPGGEPAPLPSIAEIAVGDDRFETLVTAATAAGLVEALSGEDKYTVFAPTDEAFAALPAGVLDTLLGDVEALQGVLLYHAVPGELRAADVVAADTLTAANGGTLDVTVNGEMVMINQANITQVDILARNGVVHVIDSVLVPAAPEPAEPTIADIVINSPDHNTLEAAVVAAGLAGVLSEPGTITIFAPTDAAFAALPPGTVEALLADIPTLTAILTYHASPDELPASAVVEADFIRTVSGLDINVIVNEAGVFVNGAQVTMTDIEASNGVVHVIDSVLLPPTITDLVVGDPRFTTLEAAVVAADLAGTLAGGGPFTVFAPTDAAFAALPAGTVEGLLQDIPTLTSILTYHVVSGAVDAATVVELPSATTLNGADVTIRVEGGNVFVNGAQVIITDIMVANGIVHVIDGVLLPPAAR
jgi:uncharacterized surface protein with fasciclin (FAS1) repeats